MIIGKHPVSALMELTSKRRWGSPSFELCFEHGPPHKKQFVYKVIVNGVEYQPCVATGNKKLAKANAAAFCLQSLGLLPTPNPELVPNAPSPAANAAHDMGPSMNPPLVCTGANKQPISVSITPPSFQPAHYLKTVPEDKKIGPMSYPHQTVHANSSSNSTEIQPPLPVEPDPSEMALMPPPPPPLSLLGPRRKVS